MYPDSAQKIRQRRLDEAPVAWSVGEDVLADYEEGDDLYQYLYRVNGAEPIEGRLMAAREHEAVMARYTNDDGSRMAEGSEWRTVKLYRASMGAGAHTELQTMVWRLGSGNRIERIDRALS